MSFLQKWNASIDVDAENDHLTDKCFLKYIQSNEVCQPKSAYQKLNLRLFFFIYADIFC